MPAEGPPIHFLTIVLNGEPFLRYHIDRFRRLPFAWHWHIVEGVAELKHDTAWSVAAGGHVAPACHRGGKSIDGTTEYLDQLQMNYPDRVTVYRKEDGVCWDGKKEMVNAPLEHIREECLLWQVDADELWTEEQIAAARRMFLDHPEKSAAYYWCWYFVGERLAVRTRNCYSQNPRVEWLRTWRFRPGMRWSSHEPPRLVERIEGTEGGPTEVDVGTLNPFTHGETEAAGLVFQHFAYVTPEQLLFKEQYYAYHNAFVQWYELQRQTEFPRLLRRHFAWVKDHTEVDTAANLGVVPLARKAADTWRFEAAEDSTSGVASLSQEDRASRSDNCLPRFIVDGVFFQIAQTGVARVWRSLLEEWVKSGLARQVTVLDRGGSVPAIPGIRRRPFPLYDYDFTGRDAYLIQQVCDEEQAGSFISSYYTTPLETPSVFLAYDMIPEVLGADLSHPSWREKHYSILHASSCLGISQNTVRDLLRYYPDVPAVALAYPGVGPDFRPAEPGEVERFRITRHVARSYFLLVGERLGFNGYKNTRLFFRAFAQLPGREQFAIVCAGGRPELEAELRAAAGNCPVVMLSVTDDELRQLIPVRSRLSIRRSTRALDCRCWKRWPAAVPSSLAGIRRSRKWRATRRCT